MRNGIDVALRLEETRKTVFTKVKTKALKCDQNHFSRIEEDKMNAPIIKLDDIDIYSEILPQGFVDETRKRKELLSLNKKESQKKADAVGQNCEKMVSEFISLETRFAENSRSYARLEQANRKNHAAYSDLGAQLKELSRQLRECCKSIRQSSLAN